MDNLTDKKTIDTSSVDGNDIPVLMSRRELAAVYSALFFLFYGSRSSLQTT